MKYSFKIILIAFVSLFILSGCKKDPEVVKSDEHFELGTRYLEENDYHNALLSFDQVIEKDKANYKKSQDYKKQAIMAILDLEIEKADKKATQYDYDGAIALLNALDVTYQEYDAWQEAIDRYEEQKEKLVPYTQSVPHIFFHSLIVDTSKAFDGDAMANGYNMWMTTVSEFNLIIQQMYDKGYVLVDIHEIAQEINNDSGSSHFIANQIMLPDGKIPFVLSIDDVNYYQYMETDGFAKRLVLDENGDVKNEYVKGNEILIGNYDVIPLLDQFVEEHPDFSYKGAKGIIAVTGYEGILGYRLNNNDRVNENYNQEVEDVTKVIERLKETGWIFASHSWGHLDMAKCSDYWFVEDDIRWKQQVGKYVGETDVYIYPFGAEINYSTNRLNIYLSQGYKYFCGVYAIPYVSVNQSYIRQTRINLDGYMMLNRSQALQRYFDIDTVLDTARPPLQ